MGKRILALAVAACLALPALAQPDQGLNVRLVCDGDGEKQGVENEYSYSWDHDKLKTKTSVETRNEPYTATVFVEVSEGPTSYQGRIKLAKVMVPEIHKHSEQGWYPLEDIRVSDDEIRARFSFGGANKPKLSLDRRSGRISLDGWTHFHAKCELQSDDKRLF